ncbi:MAG: histidinol dehydrogenase [Muribaculaceae bacterium]|nr:histidinol dehydrogenase [Muribaculaceae bacterium]
MNIFVNPPRQEWDALCRRGGNDNAAVLDIVTGILENVKTKGDSAIRELAARIDGVELDDLRVSQAEISEAAASISAELKEAIAQAIANIEAFHAAQLPKEITVETMQGVTCIQRPVPIDSVGLYIPGGTAPLFSTVLMLGIPARIAGCRRVIMCTPCGKDGKVSPAVVYAASRCGITEVYKVGGAQAVAAMAYGTESIPRVNKIFGPGNRFVTMAKQIVSTQGTAIDMPAGPSEVMVLADSSANPEFVAADFLSQCEHGRDSQAIAVCDSVELAEAIAAATEAQAARLQRAEFVKESLSASRIVVLDDRKKMIEFANQYAAEHLIISLADPYEALAGITAAGSVFLGNYSPESAGDYASGTNHTLPTAGWAASLSGVNTESFMRRMTIQEITPAGIAALAPTIITMARAEGLDAHANAVIVRMDSLNAK